MKASESDSNQPAEFRLGHQRWLDGLRGVAILLVIAHHYGLLLGGFLGVDLFFVLSGFLITCLLLQEYRQTGTIRLTRFDQRRALRLLPALFLTLLVMGVWIALVRPRLLNGFWHAALVVVCFGGNMQDRLHHATLGELVVTWSLSLEEQFYFVWPVLLLVLLRFRAPRAAILGLVVVGIVGVAAARAWLFSSLDVTDPRYDHRLFLLYTRPEARCDALLCGCLAAIVTSWNFRPRALALRRGLQTTAFLSIAFIVACIYSLTSNHPDCYRWLFTAFALATAALIVCTLAAPIPPLLRALGWRPLVGVGRISYGLYLFHLPVAAILGFRPRGSSEPGRTLMMFVISVLAATLSYYAIERPILRLKDRFRPTSMALPLLPVAQSLPMRSAA